MSRSILVKFLTVLIFLAFLIYRILFVVNLIASKLHTSNCFVLYFLFQHALVISKCIGRNLYKFLVQEGDDELSKSILDERAKKAEAWHRDAAARARYTKPSAPITCATFAQDVLEGRADVSQLHEHKHQPMIFGPASLVSKNPTSEREKIAAQVFQPHYRYVSGNNKARVAIKKMEIDFQYLLKFCSR